jgi:hypothetical protein
MCAFERSRAANARKLAFKDSRIRSSDASLEKSAMNASKYADGDRRRTLLTTAIAVMLAVAAIATICPFCSAVDYQQ